MEDFLATLSSEFYQNSTKFVLNRSEVRPDFFLNSSKWERTGNPVVTPPPIPNNNPNFPIQPHPTIHTYRQYMHTYILCIPLLAGPPFPVFGQQSAPCPFCTHSPSSAVADICAEVLEDKAGFKKGDIVYGFAAGGSLAEHRVQFGVDTRAGRSLHHPVACPPALWATFQGISLCRGTQKKIIFKLYQFTCDPKCRRKNFSVLGNPKMMCFFSGPRLVKKIIQNQTPPQIEILRLTATDPKINCAYFF